MPKTGLLFLLMLVAAVSSAQNSDEYPYWRFSTNNGLLFDDVVNVQQDARGFLWIATLNGLQRYDGRRFTNFRHSANDTHSIAADRIQSMQLDKKNRLWLLLNSNRIGYMDVLDLTFHEIPVQYDPQIVKKAVARLFIDNGGNVSLLIDGNAIVTWNETGGLFTEQHTPFRWPVNWHPNYIWQDRKQNSYWIACDEGLSKYNPNLKSLSYRGHNVDNDPVIQAFEPLNAVSFPYIDKSGRFWLTSWSTNENLRLLSYDPGTKKTGSYADDLYRQSKGLYLEIYGFKEQEDGTLWVTGQNLLAKFNRQTNTFDAIQNNSPTENSIRYDVVRGLDEDREHNLWASTNKGLYRFNPSALVFHTILNRRPGSDRVFTQNVAGILETKDGHILISTRGDGVFAYDKDFKPVRLDYINETLHMPANSVWCMLQRNNGDIWQGGQSGYLSISHPATGKTEYLHDPSFNGTIRQLVGDSSGNIWLGTQGGGLIKWDSGTHIFTALQKFASYIWRIYTDSAGYIWVCTQANGLYKINSADGRIAAHYTSDGPPGKVLTMEQVFDILQYNDSLFVIASDGLNILNTHTGLFSYFTTETGLPSNIVNAMIKDKSGVLWIVSEGGLSSVNLQKKITVTYTLTDGVRTHSFNAGASVQLNDGRIAFGTFHDAVVFDPQKVLECGNDVPPDVLITGITLMNKSLKMDSLDKLPLIELPHDANSLLIKFSPLTYLTAYAIFYKLEGFDNDWKPCRTLPPEIAYNYLPPGTYTFKLYCKNGDGVMSKHITELKFKVKASFWKTTWFLSLLAFLLIGILYWLDKLRTQKIRATEAIRTRIATSLTEDLGSSLSSINLTSELAKTKADSDTERTKEYIEQISDISHRMIDAMYDMIWSLGPQNDSMEHTIGRMKNYTNEMESIYNIDIVFDIDKAAYLPEPGMENRYGLLVVFKEAVLNACRHSKAKHIYINLSYKNSRLLVTVQDDGKGFDVEAAKLGRGINEMQRRALAINAQLTIQSEINTGSMIRLEKYL